MPDQDPKTHRFLPGNNLSKGRPVGSRNKLGTAFLDDMYADWQDHGKAVIAAVRDNKPDQYLKVVASLLPKDINLNVNDLEDVSDDELVQRLRELDSVIRPFLADGGISEDKRGAEAQTAKTKH